MAPTTDQMNRDALGSLVVLEPADIDRLPWQPVTGCPGVEEKELWRFDDFVHALIRLAPGASTPGRPHLAADHHIWVISGTATIAGRSIAPGSYAHVPSATAHPIDAGPQGCTLLQMHRPHPPREAGEFHGRSAARD